MSQENYDLSTVAGFVTWWSHFCRKNCGGIGADAVLNKHGAIVFKFHDYKTDLAVQEHIELLVLLPMFEDPARHIEERLLLVLNDLEKKRNES